MNGVTVTSACLSILILFNIYVGRYTAAFVVTGGVLIFRFIAWWFSESKAQRVSSPNKIIHVNRKAQQLLIEKLHSSSPRLASNKKKILIQNQLQAVINSPTEPNENSNVCFVLTHPWAPLGGDMNNNVPVQVGGALASFGYHTVRFNFRGVGKSKGCCTWRGHGERKDIKTICDWIVSEKGLVNVKHIILVGYSYGSMISNSCADLCPEIKGFVSIATPFPCYWGLSLFNCAAFLKWSRETSKPKLFLCGDEDDFTGKSNYKRYTRSFQGDNKSVYLLEGIDHSWFDSELVAAELIIMFLQEKKVILSKNE